jgi:hypothetical protein
MQLMAERSHMDVFIDQLRSDAFAFAGLVNLLTLAFCFDQLSSGETAACIESHRPLSVAKAIRRSNRARYRPIIQVATRPHITRTTYARPCARLPLVVLTCGITVGFQGFVRIRQPYVAMHQFHA